MLVVAEDDRGLLDATLLLDEDALGTVDHDVADGVVLEQELKRTKAEGLVEDFFNQALAFSAVEHRVFGVDELLDDGADLTSEGGLIEVVDAVGIEAVDELGVDGAFEAFELLGHGVGRLGLVAGLGSGGWGRHTGGGGTGTWRQGGEGG